MTAERPSSHGDLKALVGSTLGPGTWRLVSQTDVDRFADVTRDRQWIHVDPARAADSDFGSTIAHGLLTLSLGPALLAELMSFDGFALTLNYGYDRIRFTSPLRVGSRVRMLADVTSAQLVMEGVSQVVIRQTFETEGQAKPVCIADAIARFVEV